MYRNQAGFTLIELLIASALAALIAAAAASFVIPKFRNKLTDSTTAEIYTIQQAAHDYFIDKQKWPNAPSCGNAITKLHDAGWLIGIDATSPWGKPYVTLCTDKKFEILTNIPAPYTDRALGDLVDARKAGAVLLSSVPKPGAIELLKGKYLSRIDTGNDEDRTMEADLLMDGHDINLGGDDDDNGGSIKNAHSVRFDNGTRVISDGDHALKVDADQLKIGKKLTFAQGGESIKHSDCVKYDKNGACVSGLDIQNAGAVRARDFITDNGVSLAKGVQDVFIRVDGQIIKTPNCPAPLSPSYYVAPVAFAGRSGSSTGNYYPMGAVVAYVSKQSGAPKLVMQVADTQNKSHPPAAPFNKALVITKCE